MKISDFLRYQTRGVGSTEFLHDRGINGSWLIRCVTSHGGGSLPLVISVTVTLSFLLVVLQLFRDEPPIEDSAVIVPYVPIPDKESGFLLLQQAASLISEEDSRVLYQFWQR